MILKEINFSIWSDFIERGYLKGEFLELLNSGTINGATSNPAIFKQAFTTSPLYRDEIKKYSSLPKKEIYEKLAIEDISSCAAALEPLYHRGDDGFVSIEIDPFFCDDIKHSIDEGVRLYEIIGKENVMIKVPATSAGYVVMDQLASQGINVNATLIFSDIQAKNCFEAISNGMAKSGTKSKGVLSVFVSRFDRKCDGELKKAGLKTGVLGIYNAMKIYNDISHFAHPDIRVLFASTGTKGDEYPKSYYISELLLCNTINTAPIETIRAFVDNGDKMPKDPRNNEEILYYINSMKRAGIDYKVICDELLKEGLVTFKDSFKELLDTL